MDMVGCIWVVFDFMCSNESNSDILKKSQGSGYARYKKDEGRLMGKTRRKKQRTLSISFIIIALLFIIGCTVYLRATTKNGTSIMAGDIDEKNKVDKAASSKAEGNNKAAELTSGTKELFEKFLAGEIDAVSINEDGTKTSVSVYDLDLNGGEWDSFSFYGYKDVDNDGEEELVLQGPYGFAMFDTDDGSVFLFAEGEGAGATCLLSNYNDKCWIVYAHAYADGDDFRFMQYLGSENMVDSFAVYSEPDESGNTVYHYSSQHGEDAVLTEAQYHAIIDTIQVQ